MFVQSSDRPDKSIRVDQTTTASTTYVGVAAVGGGESSPIWQIYKVVESGSDCSVLYADGDSHYDNIWDDRESLTYV